MADLVVRYAPKNVPTIPSVDALKDEMYSAYFIIM